MGKLAIPFINKTAERREAPYTKKNMSHGTHRAKRKPNSKRITNGSSK